MSWSDPRANEGADPIQDPDPTDLDDLEGDDEKNGEDESS
jgi:hypothetical protein